MRRYSIFYSIIKQCIYTHLILVAISEFSRSLQISSCCTIPAFSVEIRYVQFLSIEDVIANFSVQRLYTVTQKNLPPFWTENIFSVEIISMAYH
jgi:hypothetical protein